MYIYLDVYVFGCVHAYIILFMNFYMLCFVLVQMSSADVARSQGGDGGGEDRRPPDSVPSGCGGCFIINRGKNLWIIVIQAYI